MDPTFQLAKISKTRFLSHTKADAECIVWNASLRRGGYGQFNAGREGARRVIVPAHRFAWIAEHGPIPDGMLVYHRCDNRLCVNPAHLFLGTYGDNNRDMFAKGRGHVFDGTHILGAKNSLAKLTDESVSEIRRRLSDGEQGTALAKEYGVTAANISSIRTGKTWPVAGVAQKAAQERRSDGAK